MMMARKGVDMFFRKLDELCGWVKDGDGIKSAYGIGVSCLLGCFLWGLFALPFLL